MANSLTVCLNSVIKQKSLFAYPRIHIHVQLIKLEYKITIRAYQNNI